MQNDNNTNQLLNREWDSNTLGERLRGQALDIAIRCYP